LRLPGCIQYSMSVVLTVRVPGSLMSKLDRKAAALGRVRAEHVRQLLEEDVSEPEPKRKRFACLSLIGKYSLGHGSDNEAVRQAFKRRFNEKQNR
jgi:hypothetical protein